MRFRVTLSGMVTDLHVSLESMDQNGPKPVARLAIMDPESEDASDMEVVFSEPDSISVLRHALERMEARMREAAR